ncbi:hypothetical protein D3C71_1532020 [compost metagenome]
MRRVRAAPDWSKYSMSLFHDEYAAHELGVSERSRVYRYGQQFDQRYDLACGALNALLQRRSHRLDRRGKLEYRVAERHRLRCRLRAYLVFLVRQERSDLH